MEIDYAGILLAEYLNGYVILSKNENCRVWLLRSHLCIL
jgi:hypothetical protein